MLVGSVPPIFGGVSVHLQRLLPQLAERGIPHVLLDISGTTKNAANVICTRWRKAVLRLLREPRAILHFHNFTPFNLLVYALLGLRHRTILSLHNTRFIDELNGVPTPIRGLVVRMLNRLDAIIVSSDAAAELLRPLVWDNGKLVVCPEFIPPAAGIHDELPLDIAALRRHRYLLASTAFRLCFHQGQDAYGVDLLIDLVAALVHQDGLDAAIVFLLPSIGDSRYFDFLQARVRQVNIQDRFLFVTQPVAEACAVWRQSDVVIRATNTDGAPLSIKEALWCGTPVIASDCVPRGPHVVSFTTRDPADLRAKTVQVLTHLKEHRTRVQNASLEDNVQPLVDIYTRLMQNG